MHAELVFFNGCLVAEGPCWDAARDCLYFVDIHGGSVYRWYVKTGKCDTWNFGMKVGCVALRSGGGLIVACKDGIYSLNTETGEKRKIACPEPRPHMRFNDGKCDPAGRLLIGTLDEADRTPGAGALHAFDSEGSTRAVILSLTVPNGLCFAADGQTLYLIDTLPNKTVTAYDYDIKNGTAGNPRQIIALSDQMGFPDGMTIDAEGMLWIAESSGYCVGRWDPQTGEKIDQVDLPVPMATCPVFGGRDLRDMYITTARMGVDGPKLAGGGIFRVRTDVCGLPAYEYKG
jgi:sugar lactone lactonase YvrE